ncbi:tetratricopeptide repeat protein [Shewanella inventionis]|uniref:tetratricopeptide repeat protein n=1 Tax=Shewanella inventionis TaxID=1738770 RepID=UPI001CC0F497|nr:tetratricopeptide repeat protein [Shewanella inventionis]UAL42538.1 tetratricopeptide repeat protein [Shewanella inventionis]
MLRLAHLVLFISLFLSSVADAKDLEQQEIEFKENPNKLLIKLSKSTEFPLQFTNKEEFSKIANDLGYEPIELQRDLEVLARVNLETNLSSPTKYDDAKLLIGQLDAIASNAFDEAMVIMLKARLRARENKEYQPIIVQYMDALNKINTDMSLQATLFKYIIHEHLGGLHMMLLQSAPSLSHYNRYREIAYQLHNDYFIAEAETALGKYYNRNGDKAKSLQHFSEAFRLASGVNYPMLKSQALINLARTYRDLEQWDDALKYAHGAAEIQQQLGFETYLAETLNVIAMVYEGQEKWSKAVDYYLNAQQVNERVGNVIAVGINFHNIGGIYAKLNNIPAALNALQRANDIFRSLKTNHYLVHNELLFTQINAQQGQWAETIDHAKKTLELAKKLKQTDIQIETLGYLSTAYRKTNELNAAIDTVESIITLTNNHDDDTKDDKSYSELTEQKLKFELTLLSNKLEQQTTKNKHHQLIIILLAFSLSIVIAVVIFIWRKLALKNALYLNAKVINHIEPMTQIAGYRAFIEKLDTLDPSEPQTLALINIDELNNLDIQLGLTESRALMQKLIVQMSQHLNTEVFMIRSGQLACYFNQQRNADYIYDALVMCLEKLNTIQPNIPHFAHLHDAHKASIGHINLPLLSNPDVNISAQLHFETLQYALAAAIDIKEKPAYVSLRPLNFAPAAIFMPPLYLNLTQALNRGIIRAESNRNTLDINWPKS